MGRRHYLFTKGLLVTGYFQLISNFEPWLTNMHKIVKILMMIATLNYNQNLPVIYQYHCLYSHVYACGQGPARSVHIDSEPKVINTLMRSSENGYVCISVLS